LAYPNQDRGFFDSDRPPAISRDQLIEGGTAIAVSAPTAHLVREEGEAERVNDRALHLERGVRAPEAMGEDVKLRLFSGSVDLLESCQPPPFGMMTEMAKDASPFAFADIENSTINRVHVCIDVVPKPAGDITWNRLDRLHVRHLSALAGQRTAKPRALQALALLPQNQLGNGLELHEGSAL
jgi:hypothetical protein